ncbi:MAG: hypothetical protein QOK34_1490 [Gaiellaceae bacterium]|nr:hypothetical protein [Gaiellaceae bacterium]
MRKVVVLGTVAAALAVAVSAAARSTADTVKWLTDPNDITGDTVVLRVTSSSAFKSLFLYPNGAFTISVVAPPACRAVPAPKGQGVGCSLGSATSASVTFTTNPPIQVGTSAKLVLDNADGSGARALTATLESCALYEGNLEAVNRKLGEAYAEYRRALHDLVQVENAGLALLFWGELGALAHDKAVDDFHAAQKQLARVRTDAEKAKKALEDCQGTSAGASTRALSSSGRRVDCTEEDVGPLLARGEKLKLRKFTPLIRKIIAERKRKQKTAASRDLKRFHAQLKAEAKAAKGLKKAVDACK